MQFRINSHNLRLYEYCERGLKQQLIQYDVSAIGLVMGLVSTFNRFHGSLLTVSTGDRLLHFLSCLKEISLMSFMDSPL